MLHPQNEDNGVVFQEKKPGEFKLLSDSTKVISKVK
jgi:hypothetical protein